MTIDDFRTRAIAASIDAFFDGFDPSYRAGSGHAQRAGITRAVDATLAEVRAELLAMAKAQADELELEGADALNLAADRIAPPTAATEQP